MGRAKCDSFAQYYIQAFSTSTFGMSLSRMSAWRDVQNETQQQRILGQNYAEE
jgi:hypothetical protein